MICNGTNWISVMEYKDTGEVLFQNAYDSGACTTAKDGRLRYSSGASPPWEYCDGTNWVNFKQPRCQDNDTGECYLQATRSSDDPEFIASNIKDGINILGVTGSLAGGSCGYDQSNLPPSSGSITGCVSGQTVSWGTVTDNGNGTVTIASPLAFSNEVLSNASSQTYGFCADLGLFAGQSSTTSGRCGGYSYDAGTAQWTDFSAVCSFACNCNRADSVTCMVPP